MDETRLAQDVVERLAPFLNELLEKRALTSGASPRQQMAHRLWRVIFPKIALRSGVILAARNIAEENSSENRAALSMQLALVFRTNTFLAADVQQTLMEGIGGYSPAAQTSPVRPRRFDQEYSAEQISCQVCSGQDETLRLIGYPFVFSLVLVTFRRMFQGVYCSRHANRYFFLAGIISLTVGWLGIPFGLIFTPITLLNLYTADKKLRSANAKLLFEIAKAKQEKGDPQEAAVFLQEAIWLDDKQSENITPDLVKVALVRADALDLVSQVFALLSGFGAAWLMGFLIGLVNGLFSNPFNQLESQVPILLIMFSYLPLVAMLYFGSFIIARFNRWMLERTLISSGVVGRITASVAALIAFYAILTGQQFFNVQSTIRPVAGSLIEVVIHGGWLTLAGLFRQRSTADLLFVVMVILGLMSFVWLGQDWAHRTIRWRRATDQIRGLGQRNSGKWAAVIALLVVTILAVILGFVFFPA